MDKVNLVLFNAKLLLLITTTIFCCASYAADVQTQGEMNEAACKEYKDAEQVMTRIYKQILMEYRTDKVFVNKLKIAQGAWTNYKNAHVEAIYPNTDRSEYGTVYEMCRCDVLAAMTKNRTKELEQWSDGVDEGDVCAGSRKSKIQTAE